MQGKTPSVQISVVALMTGALVRLTIDMSWLVSDDKTYLLLAIAQTVLATAAFAAVIPFALSRLPAWGRAGLGVWGASVLIAVYSTIWLAYALHHRGRDGWLISDTWFAIEPMCLATALAVIAIAAVRGVAAVEQERPRGLEYAAFGAAAAGATTAVAQVFVLVAGPGDSNAPLERLADISLVIETIVLAGVLSLARARIAVKDLPEARTLN